MPVFVKDVKCPICEGKDPKDIPKEDYGLLCENCRCKLTMNSQNNKIFSTGYEYKELK